MVVSLTSRDFVAEKPMGILDLIYYAYGFLWFLKFLFREANWILVLQNPHLFSKKNKVSNFWVREKIWKEASDEWRGWDDDLSNTLPREVVKGIPLQSGPKKKHL